MQWCNATKNVIYSAPFAFYFYCTTHDWCLTFYSTNTFDSSSQLLERIIPGHFRNDYPNKILEQSTGLHLSAQVIFLIMEFVSVEHDEPFTFSMKTSRSCVCVRTCVGALVSGQDRIHLPIWEPISGNAHIWTYVCQSHMSLVPFMPIYGEPWWAHIWECSYMDILCQSVLCQHNNASHP